MDVLLSEVTLGTWGLVEETYGRVSQVRFEETVGAAHAHGINTFDVSPIWGTEEDGETRIAPHLRSDSVVITRGGVRREGDTVQQSFLRQDLVADCEASLRRLKRDAIDVWLLHHPSVDELQAHEDEWLQAANDLKSDGKIRAWGVSVVDAESARLAIAAGAEAVCLTHNLLRSAADELTSELVGSGCGLLARSPLAHGMLGGHWNTARSFPQYDHRSRRWGKGAFAERLRQVDSLRFLVGDRHPDLATAALRFSLAHDAVATTMVGARNPYQVAAAAEAIAQDAAESPSFTEGDLRRISKIRGVYNRTA